MDKPVDLWSYDRAFRKVPDGIIRALAKDPLALAVYMQILLRARWSAGYVRGSHGLVWLEPGQAIVGETELAAVIGNQRGTTRGALARLQRLQILTNSRTKRGTIVTLLNYGETSESSGSTSPTASPQLNHGRTTDEPRLNHGLATNVDQVEVSEDPKGKEERESPSLDSLRVIREAYEYGYRKAHRLPESTRVEWTHKRHQKPLEELLSKRTQEEILGAFVVMFGDDAPEFPTGRDIETLDKFFDKFQSTPATYDPTGRNGIRIVPQLDATDSYGRPIKREPIKRQPRIMIVGGKEYVLPDDDEPITGIGDVAVREMQREQLNKALEAERRAQAAEMLQGFADGRAKVDAAEAQEAQAFASADDWAAARAELDALLEDE